MSHTLIMLAIIYTWNTNNVLFELIALMWKRGNGTNNESDQARKHYIFIIQCKKTKKKPNKYISIFLKMPLKALLQCVWPNASFNIAKNIVGRGIFFTKCQLNEIYEI